MNVNSSTTGSRARTGVILLLEDHEPYRKLACLALGQYLGGDVKVVEAAEVPEALNLLRLHPVDVLVADVMLADGNCRELLESVRGFVEQGLKVVLFSNHRPESLRALIGVETVHEFAAKEDGLVSLAEKIRSLLGLTESVQP